MTSILIQSKSFDENTTLYNDHNDTTTAITTEEFSTDNILSTPFINDSCHPDCYTISTSNDDTDVTLTNKLIYSILGILLVITISIVLIFRRFQHSIKQNRRSEGSVRIEKPCARPFEEFLVVGDEPQSIQLLEINPTTTLTN